MRYELELYIQIGLCWYSIKNFLYTVHVALSSHTNTFTRRHTHPYTFAVSNPSIKMPQPKPLYPIQCSFTVTEKRAMIHLVSTPIGVTSGVPSVGGKEGRKEGSCVKWSGKKKARYF